MYQDIAAPKQRIIEVKIILAKSIESTC